MHAIFGLFDYSVIWRYAEIVLELSSRVLLRKPLNGTNRSKAD